MVASLVVMAGAAAFIAFAPKPSPVLSPSQLRSQLTKTKIAIKTAEKTIGTAKVVIEKETWPGTAEEVLPLALQKVASIAKDHHLKIIGFHPQNVILSPNISQVPLVVNVDGSFTSVVEFERALEAPGTNLTVNLMQLATADQESNKVTASIGIVAFQPVVNDTATKPGDKPAAGANKNA